MSASRFALLCWLAATALGAAEYTVAPHGDDAAAGTPAAPLATVLRARDLARRALAGGDRAITVTLRAGVHALAEPLYLGSADAPPGTSVRWQGEPGAVLSGGIPLTGWRTGADGLQTCILPAVEAARGGLPALVRGAELLPPSRWPEGKPATVAAIGPGGPALVPRPPAGDGELLSIFDWGVCRAPVAVDARGALRLPPGMPWADSVGKSPTPGRPLFIEGLARPAPGQWRLLRADGVATVELAVDTRPADGEIRLCALSTVLVIAGEPGHPIGALAVSGLAIAHAAWPRPPGGVEGIQAGHVATIADEASVSALPAAVRIAWAEGVSLTGLAVAGNAASGIAIGPGCHGVRIERCTVREAGGCGIVVGWRGEGLASASQDWDDPRAIPRDTVVDRNLVARCGLTDWGSVGIADIFSNGTAITGNRVEDLPYTGISLGMRWDTGGTSQRRARVEGNHIRRVMRSLLDGGGIYTLGWQPGAKILGNLIEDLGGPGYTDGAPAGGLFFDQGSKGIQVAGNVIARIHGEPLRFNGCAQSWMILGENTVVPEGGTASLPPVMAEGVGP